MKRKKWVIGTIYESFLTDTWKRKKMSHVTSNLSKLIPKLGIFCELYKIEKF